jgi:hypothetical protein
VFAFLLPFDTMPQELLSLSAPINHALSENAPHR